MRAGWRNCATLPWAGSTTCRIKGLRRKPNPALSWSLLWTCAGTESVNQSKWDSPPYAIDAGTVRQGLAAKTAPMTAYYNNDPSDIHYNRHNLYGLEESMATHRVVANITRERPFVLTRWAASGQHARPMRRCFGWRLVSGT